MKEVNFTKLMLLLADARSLSETQDQKKSVEKCKDELLKQMQNLQKSKKALNEVWNNL